MKSTKTLIKQTLISFTGNNFMQNILDKVVRISQYFMGIGAGTGVDSSGEKIAFTLLQHKVKSPYVIFDVGANKGMYLNLILQVMKDYDFQVHCFEPGSYTFAILEKSFRSEHKDKIKLNKAALGKLKGELELYYDQPGSGLASLTKRKLDHFGIDFSTSEKVNITTIDDYCSANNVNHIHLLKCDVEGHELDVFQGAAGMFKDNAVDIVTFEFGGCNIDTRNYFQDFYYFFKDIKMEIYRITPSGYLKHIDSYKESEEQFRTTNYVAIKKSLC